MGKKLNLLARIKSMAVICIGSIVAKLDNSTVLRIAIGLPICVVVALMVVLCELHMPFVWLAPFAIVCSLPVAVVILVYMLAILVVMFGSSETEILMNDIYDSFREMKPNLLGKHHGFNVYVKRDVEHKRVKDCTVKFTDVVDVVKGEDFIVNFPEGYPFERVKTNEDSVNRIEEYK